jgi:hypothetical protein
MHDLVRDYARTLDTHDPDDVAAVGQLFGYYLHAVTLAEARLSRQTRPAITTDPPAMAVPDLADRTQDVAWMRIERANLLACIADAASDGRDAMVVGLTAAWHPTFESTAPGDRRPTCTVARWPRPSGSPASRSNQPPVDRVDPRFGGVIVIGARPVRSCASISAATRLAVACVAWDPLQR